VSSVKINGTSAQYTVNSDTSITLTVPSGATSGKITVTTPGGTATSTLSYTVIQAPTITSFTPTSGGADVSVATTVTVVIKGTYLVTVHPPPLRGNYFENILKILQN
jgi:hypothetical protein